MDNQHRKITGYRELSQDEIDLINDIKYEGERLKDVIGRVRRHLERQRVDAEMKANASDGEFSEELDRIEAAEPSKWLNWGHDSGQTVIMYLTRAVAQPTTF